MTFHQIFVWGAPEPPAPSPDPITLTLPLKVCVQNLSKMCAERAAKNTYILHACTRFMIKLFYSKRKRSGIWTWT